jgi:hypothetical protein
MKGERYPSVDSESSSLSTEPGQLRSQAFTASIPACPEPRWGLELGGRQRGHQRRAAAVEVAHRVPQDNVPAVWEFWFPTTPRFGFRRDFLLNRHWTPRGVTTFQIIGGVACLLVAACWLIEIKKRELRWLVILGQAALMLYFVQQFIELTLVNKALGWRFDNWPLYGAANAVLLVLLVYLGKAWLALKQLMRRAAAVQHFGAPRPESA